MKTYLLAALLLAAEPVLAQAAPPASAPPSLLASAVVAGLVSAAVSGLVALLVKDKEYRNEYFKKVIEKRLKGIEAIEDAAAPLRVYYLFVGKDGVVNKYHAFFMSLDNSEVFTKAVSNTSQYIVWHSGPTIKAFNNFTEQVSKIIRDGKNMDENARMQMAINEFKKISDIMAELRKCITKDMLTLHNVDVFFKHKLKGHKQ